MQLTVHAFAGGETSVLEVSDDIFGGDFNEALVHQVITAYMACGRADTKAWKNRSAVRGGGAKPWRQKGLGRARAGTNTSPLWRTGGVTFGSSRASHQQKVNKKMYRAAMRSVVAEQVRRESMKVFDRFEFEKIKTKQVEGFLKQEGVNDSRDRILFIDDQWQDAFVLSVRNVPTLSLCDVSLVDPVTLFKAKRIYITTEGMKKLEERLS